jgi:2-polyprenyl-3-methyl-5-hydroxy-6-metoxy-1,4-benzoquinol methylase
MQIHIKPDRMRRWLTAVDDKKSTWDRQASEWVRHAANPNDKYTRLLGFVVQVLERHIKEGTGLDVGCGPAALSQMLAERGFETYGTDISQSMIDAAVARMGQVMENPAERFRLCEDGEVPFDGMQFDLITAIQMFPYVAHFIPFIRELSSHLKPGGIIAATNTNRLSLWVAHEILDRVFRIPPHLRTIRNLARTGYHSGGHVEYGTSQQVYDARAFDALFIAEGFEVIDSLDYYYISALDKATLPRQGLGKRLTRRFAWQRLGVYRKAIAPRKNQ